MDGKGRIGRCQEQARPRYEEERRICSIRGGEGVVRVEAGTERHSQALYMTRYTGQGPRIERERRRFDRK